MKKIYVTTPAFLNLSTPVSDAYVMDLSILESQIKEDYSPIERENDQLVINFPRIIGNTINYDWLNDYIILTNLYQPDMVILPSLLERCEKTNEIVSYWKEHAPATITAGTIEATSYDQVLTSYNFLKNNVDIIVFDTLIFNAEDVLREHPEADIGIVNSKCREKIIDYLVTQGALDTSKQHLFVGLGSPYDFNLINTCNYISGVLTRLPSWYALRKVTMSDSISTYQNTENSIDYLEQRDDNDEDSAILERINNSVDYLRQAIAL
jgi:hypothetical protein